MTTDDDLGLFGPGSATWKVHSEPIVMVGGLRSLYLQALHPRAVAGVMQNSAYKKDPWGRLARTSNYVGTVLFGTTAQAEQAGARLRAIHSRLTGTDAVTGDRFRVNEPDLLRWVHVTEVESFVTSAVRAGLRLTPAEHDAYFDEQRRAAALVGLDPATVPGSKREVEDYYAEMRPQLAMTKDAAEAAVFLSVPPMPWGLGLTPVRGVMLGVSALAVGMLPAWARRMYGLPGLAATDLVTSVNSRMLRTALRALPRRYVTGPIYKDAMRRAAKAQSAGEDAAGARSERSTALHGSATGTSAAAEQDRR